MGVEAGRGVGGYIEIGCELLGVLSECVSQVLMGGISVLLG